MQHWRSLEAGHVVAGELERVMKKWIAGVWAVIFAIGLLAISRSAAGHETDNYSVPFNQSFADLAPLFDERSPTAM
jgi:hypothetical protein